MTMTPLTEDQVFSGRPWFEASIPPQAVDIEEYKKTEETVEESAESFGLAYIVMFGLMFFLKFGMELFWGSIRNLQVVFTLTLIRFKQTTTMNTFMSGMSEFAMQDVYSGEGYYDDTLTLKVTQAMNAQYEFFGSDSMIMLTNSGSFFIIQG